MGVVALDWDAYDRLMQPYMDGTAFEDRVPLAVWLAPVPPRRIRDSSTQLWQYIDACAKHFAAGWSQRRVSAPRGRRCNHGRPGSGRAEKLRAQVSEMMRLHMPRDMLAVAAPGADIPTASYGPSTTTIRIFRPQATCIRIFRARLALDVPGRGNTSARRHRRQPHRRKRLAGAMRSRGPRVASGSARRPLLVVHTRSFIDFANGVAQ